MIGLRAKAIDTAFYRPMGARITVFWLTALGALGASGAVAYLTGQPVAGPAHVVLFAILLGQVRHGIHTFPLMIDVDLEGDDDARDSNP
jgi:hypothetical protein